MAVLLPVQGCKPAAVASTTWSEDYCLGLLSARADADLMDPASWRKSPEPVFVKNAREGVLAPGHNCFCRIGEDDYIVYHAVDGESVDGRVDTSRRSPRMHRVIWRADGTPDLGIPLPEGRAIEI